MPVAGIPDPEKHWICIRCSQWFEADEGQLIRLERPTFVGRLADNVSGDIKMRFRCDGCTRRLERNRLVFFGALAALLAVALGYALWRGELL
ncbi:MAG TPA: hypothetical protein VF033_15520 [Steroidobacteraceae bacterium]